MTVDDATVGNIVYTEENNKHGIIVYDLVWKKGKNWSFSFHLQEQSTYWNHINFVSMYF